MPDITDDQLRAIDALIAESDHASADAAAVIFGDVPAWVPRPILDRAWRTASTLWADGADPRELRRLIDEILSGKDTGAQASLPLPFIYAINELASFVYGASLGKLDGLKFLAGDQAEAGQRFKEGRKIGTLGPIRKAIDRLLKKHQDMTTPELWEAISQKPPKGWQAYNNNQGKYLEKPPKENVGYPRFQNICSEARKARKKITE